MTKQVDLRGFGTVQADTRHHRVVRAIFLVLSAPCADNWLRLIVIFGMLLTREELMELSRAALTAADQNDAMEVAHDVLGQAGPPLVPLDTIMAEAAAWASAASERECKAYTVAAIRRMSHATRAALLRWLRGCIHG